MFNAIAFSVGLKLAVALSAPAPVRLQAVLLTKVLAFDQAMSSKQIKVLVVNAGDVTSIAEAFRTTKVDLELVEPEDVAARISGTSAVYVLADGATATVLSLCEKHQVLTFTGDISLVEGGLVSVGIGTQGSPPKPEVVVNLTRMRKEGRALSADLLDLARKIKSG